MKTENKIEVLDEDETAALNAQIKLNRAIATCHIEILHRVKRLEKLGGEQDYTYTIMEVLNTFGGEVNLSFFSPVCADHALFAKARESLKAEGKIKELTVKNRKILKLVGPE